MYMNDIRIANAFLKFYFKNDIKFLIFLSFLYIVRLNFFSDANTFSIKYLFFNLLLLYLLLLFFIFLRLGAIVLTFYHHVKIQLN